jgi:hypothetical protein
MSLVGQADAFTVNRVPLWSHHQLQNKKRSKAVSLLSICITATCTDCLFNWTGPTKRSYKRYQVHLRNRHGGKTGQRQRQEKAPPETFGCSSSISSTASQTALGLTVALYVLNQKHCLPKPLSAVVSKAICRRRQLLSRKKESDNGVRSSMMLSSWVEHTFGFRNPRETT